MIYSEERLDSFKEELNNFGGVKTSQKLHDYYQSQGALSRFSNNKDHWTISDPQIYQELEDKFKQLNNLEVKRFREIRSIEVLKNVS